MIMILLIWMNQMRCFLLNVGFFLLYVQRERLDCAVITTFYRRMRWFIFYEEAVFKFVLYILDTSQNTS